jgi:putative ABC transport system permease protein
MLIAGGVVYNSARIAYAERMRDLASLRVLGFTRVETAFILLGELGVITLLALPIGGVLGYGLATYLAEAFSTELYQIPVIARWSSYGEATIIVLVSAAVSGLLVQRDVNRLDLVAALKSRE